MVTAVLENPRQTEPKPYDGFERMLVNGHWRQASGPVTEDRIGRPGKLPVPVPARDLPVIEGYGR